MNDYNQEETHCDTLIRSRHHYALAKQKAENYEQYLVEYFAESMEDERNELVLELRELQRRARVSGSFTKIHLATCPHCQPVRSYISEA